MSGSPPRVLVVDDEPFVAKIARRVLERQNIEIVTAENGEDALAAMAADPDLALVLLDSGLPDMNAERLLELMGERGLEIRVLLSSGFGTDALPEPERFPNVVGFLPKPYPVAKLSETVMELLGQRAG